MPAISGSIICTRIWGDLAEMLRVVDERFLKIPRFQSWYQLTVNFKFKMAAAKQTFVWGAPVINLKFMIIPD